MAINLSKGISDLTSRRGSSQSWTDFYINMMVDMEEIALIDLAAKGGTAALSLSSKITNNTYIKQAEDITNLTLFATSLIKEYDGLMKSGKTIIGGVPLNTPNLALAEATLVAILVSTKANTFGDLLKQIGPVFQIYWAGAALDKFPPPNIPVIGAIENISTLAAPVLFPGVWTPITVPPIPYTSQFLLSFILSAQLHLLYQVLHN